MNYVGRVNVVILTSLTKVATTTATALYAPGKILWLYVDLFSLWLVAFDLGFLPRGFCSRDPAFVAIGDVRRGKDFLEVIFSNESSFV